VFVRDAEHTPDSNPIIINRRGEKQCVHSPFVPRLKFRFASVRRRRHKWLTQEWPQPKRGSSSITSECEWNPTIVQELVFRRRPLDVKLFRNEVFLLIDFPRERLIPLETVARQPKQETNKPRALCLFGVLERVENSRWRWALSNGRIKRNNCGNPLAVIQFWDWRINNGVADGVLEQELVLALIVIWSQPQQWTPAPKYLGQISRISATICGSVNNGSTWSGGADRFKRGHLKSAEISSYTPDEQ
jgi:hypothetical protein